MAERYNPFSSSIIMDDPDPLTTNFNRSSQTSLASAGRQPASRTDSSGSASRYAAIATSSPRSSPLHQHHHQMSTTSTTTTTAPTSTNAPRYTTTFPDPFGETTTTTTTSSTIAMGDQPVAAAPAMQAAQTGNRSNSVTFAPSSHSVDDPISMASPTRPTGGRQSSGFTSFLSRATSVTSSSVTDRVSGAVGSVRSAVDSISSQIQQAVPSNINERLSTTATNLIGSGQDQLQQQQQSAASYLASKISSATGQFTGSGGSSSGSLPVISRQRVILVLDSSQDTNWPQQFNQYRRLVSGGGSGGSLGQLSSAQSALTSFFSAAGGSTGGGGSIADGTDNLVVEQADFRDVSVLSNQATSTATIYVATGGGTSSGSGRGSQSTAVHPQRQSAKIIRPEYVVVKQRTKSNPEHMRGVVTALNYCLVPMFEPIEVWNIFQDRQLMFAKLLRVQKALGKENFPLIPQIYCQTHQDLLNYINGSSVLLPCLVRTGSLGKGKIKIDNLQMLRDFASIVATSNLSCTIEQYLDVKCDLVVQRLGTSLKLFKRNAPTTSTIDSAAGGAANTTMDDQQQQQQAFGRHQSASRQTSIGSSVLSSLISSSPSSHQHQQQQHMAATRRASSSAGGVFERMSDVSARHRGWVEAIMSEFENKLEAFCVKIVVANNDREYIVGLADCSMDFLGNADNQDEDRRSFVELIISNMNTNLPKVPLSREPSSTNTATAASGGRVTNEILRRLSNEDKNLSPTAAAAAATGANAVTTNVAVDCTPLRDKKRFTSQTQINGGFPGASKNGLPGATSTSANQRAYGQLSSRSQSVSMNQSDFLAGEQATLGKSAYFSRRGSDRSDSLSNEPDELTTTTTTGSITSVGGRAPSVGQMTTGSSISSGLHQRQASLGQSFLDQTSTAFSSFQKQSMSFFKRLDSRGGDLVTGSNTPPQSAKSDRGFERGFIAATSAGNSSSSAASDQAVSSIGGTRNGFKSQSVDCSTLERPRKPRETPPKPPPPPSLANRQSSLAGSYSGPHRGVSSVTPNTTPNQTRQNSSIETDGSGSGGQRGRVVRQNSALSAFEPFDPDLASQFAGIGADQAENVPPAGHPITDATTAAGADNPTPPPKSALDSARRSTNFDSASINSGESNSTGETTTAEDTMNNLKKTFASIFGDKCD